MTVYESWCVCGLWNDFDLFVGLVFLSYVLLDAHTNLIRVTVFLWVVL